MTNVKVYSLELNSEVRNPELWPLHTYRKEAEK